MNSSLMFLAFAEGYFSNHYFMASWPRSLSILVYILEMSNVKNLRVLLATRGILVRKSISSLMQLFTLQKYGLRIYQ